jgi:N-acetylglucosamine-6-phosphate deacetylase
VAPATAAPGADRPPADRGVLIRGGSVLTTAGWRADCDVRIAAGRIVAIAPHLDADDVIDAHGQRVVPGFVDVHVHGAGGAMFEEARAEGVARISDVLAEHGTTALMATLAALPPDQLEAAVRTIAGTAPSCRGARIAGIHLEGPFLDPRHAGAQQAGWMRLPSLAEVEALQAAGGGMVRLITIAPELPGALELIAAVRARGIAVALGHSGATEADVLAALAAGAEHVTHLFNAAGPLHHREPGLIGVALTDDRLSVELICDGEHLHRRAVDIALRCKPPDRIVLVSDGVAAVGMPPGELDLFGATCIAGRAVRMKDSGRLAGSNLTLDRALRVVRGWFPQAPLERVLAWVTTAPAALLGLGGELGVLAEGRRADVVVLGEELELRAVLCGGRRVTHR